jgi:hypothetical protein
MMNPESALMQRIRLALGRRPDVRIFRNNVAMSWAGRLLKPSRTITVTVGPGDVVLYGARPIHAGLCPGSPDLVGWRSLTVTRDHVGRRLAAFAGLEVKMPDQRPTEQQEAFLGVMAAAGGLGGVVRSEDDARRAVDGL